MNEMTKKNSAWPFTVIGKILKEKYRQTALDEFGIGE